MSDLLELELAEPTVGRPETGGTFPTAGGTTTPGGQACTTTTLGGDTRHEQEADKPDDPFAATSRELTLPGSAGEHLLQHAYGTEQRANRFYEDQVLDRLNERMKQFIRTIDLAFVATADARGECDSSLRAGAPGFIEVLGDRHIAYPEYRGNGVMASLGNISENPHVGILLIDFVDALIGLHINGKARILEDSDLRAIHPDLPSDFAHGRKPERWVVVQVEEAYIHCRKHIPRMAPVDRKRAWGTDDSKHKGGDYFGAKGAPRPWHSPQPQYG